MVQLRPDLKPDCVSGVLALTNMHITVPEAVRSGDSVTLSCDYNLETAALYTIKWFRNNVEFYRYVPGETLPHKTFDMPHLHVNLSTSNWINVTLLHVQRETSGEFKCEVTADAPSFQTEARASSLIVADIPTKGPRLTTDINKVAPGGHVNANCTSPGSFPKVNITWYLNDVEIHQKIGLFSEKYATHYDFLDGLEYVISRIKLKVTTDSFENGKMKLRCQATIFNIYSKSDRVELLEDAPHVALIMTSLDDTNSGWWFPNGSSSLKWILGIVVVILFPTAPG